jgi:hypothetical protein
MPGRYKIRRGSAERLAITVEGVTREGGFRNFPGELGGLIVFEVEQSIYEPTSAFHRV